MTKKKQTEGQFLIYDFTFRGEHHRNRIELNDSKKDINYFFDKKHLEVNWVKKIRSCFEMYIDITLDDDAESEKYASVVSAPKVLVRDRLGNDLDYFEPEYWSYEDSWTPENNTNKLTFKRE